MQTFILGLFESSSDYGTNTMDVYMFVLVLPLSAIMTNLRSRKSIRIAEVKLFLKLVFRLLILVGGSLFGPPGGRGWGGGRGTKHYFVPQLEPGEQCAVDALHTEEGGEEEEGRRGGRGDSVRGCFLLKGKRV